MQFLLHGLIVCFFFVADAVPFFPVLLFDGGQLFLFFRLQLLLLVGPVLFQQVQLVFFLPIQVLQFVVYALQFQL